MFRSRGTGRVVRCKTVAKVQVLLDLDRRAHLEFRRHSAPVEGKRVQIPHGPAAVTGDNARHDVTVHDVNGKTRVVG